MVRLVQLVEMFTGGPGAMSFAAFDVAVLIYNIYFIWDFLKIIKKLRENNVENISNSQNVNICWRSNITTPVPIW